MTKSCSILTSPHFLGRVFSHRVAALRLTPLAIIAKNPFYILNYKFFLPFRLFAIDEINRANCQSRAKKRE